MNPKIIIGLTTFTLFAFCCKKEKIPQNKTHKIIEVEYPETYELANIILALTEYGKTDKWEVRQGFGYYDKVQEYFKPVNKHPLLDSVNYSRDRWEEYLSFRTDSYAFVFDEDNLLRRKLNFYANKGYQPFDTHLELINDFVAKSKFREFFAQNKKYYTAISDRYKTSQYLNEMREFLIDEFGEHYPDDKKYTVVLSPFVYRMNCHRDIDSMTVADFITIPNYVLSDTIIPNKEEIATSIHDLFTEMDHGYINPTTRQWKNLVAEKFDAKLWDNKSGYNDGEGYDDSGNATFNEYMTWGVYDIFLQKTFPDIGDEVGLNWSFQNDSRGFEYSHLFTQQLLTFYNRKKEGETLKDLYPKLLKWTSEVQKDLSKPEIVLPNDSISVDFSEKTKIHISFSEPMKKTDTITTILQDGEKLKQFIDLSSSNNKLRWSENGRTVEFEISLPSNRNVYFLQFNWWETKHPFISEKGVLLKSGSYFKVIAK